MSDILNPQERDMDMRLQQHLAFDHKKLKKSLRTAKRSYTLKISMDVGIESGKHKLPKT